MEQNLFSKVSIVIPAKDEESTLGMVLNDLFKVINELKHYSFEVIIVDDHSVDKTKQIAESFGTKVKVVENMRSPGKGNALISGFEKTTGEVIVMLDADYSHRPEDIPVFLSLIKRGFGIVVGSRATGGSEEYTLVRTFGNVVLTSFFWLITGVFLTDILNGFKAFRREIFSNHNYTSKDFEIEIELLVNALKDGYKIGEFPCHERIRAGGKMKSKIFKHGIKFFWKILIEGLKYRIQKTLKKQMVNLPCVLCGNIKNEFLFQKNTYNIAFCPKCKLGFVINPPTQEELNSYYELDYFTGNIAKFGYVDYAKELDCRILNFEKKKKKIERYFSGGRLLDVGCADGSFLNLFGKKWDKYGIEISEDIAEKSNRGYTLSQTDFLNFTDEPESFDVITMWDFIDHVTNPLEYLKKANHLLKKNGLLILNTGDMGSLCAKLMGKRWYLFIPPTHLFFFTKKSIILAFEKAGFKVLNITYEGKWATLGLCLWRLRYICPNYILNGINRFISKSFFAKLKLYFNFFDLMTIFAKK